MKFSIITPTHKRLDNLLRAVASVASQTYSDWEMIIVNDSPLDTSYAIFEHTITDPRIRYLKNTKNEGVNYSRNRALSERSIHSTWTIFLDDDDYLAPDTLETFINLISSHPSISWFVTNRAYQDGTSLTSFPQDNHVYSYARDYLILRQGKGDATHCIATNTIGLALFSTLLRQAEEWLFFYQIGLRASFLYHSHNSTITDGYSDGGLNFRTRGREAQLHTLSQIIKEGAQLKLLHHPTFLIYVAMRYVRTWLR